MGLHIEIREEVRKSIPALGCADNPMPQLLVVVVFAAVSSGSSFTGRLSWILRFHREASRSADEDQAAAEEQADGSAMGGGEVLVAAGP